MGIEPTMPLLAQSIIGFEDRGRHQSDARFQSGNYTESKESPMRTVQYDRVVAKLLAILPSVPVRVLEVSLAFYRDKLGFRVRHRMGDGGAFVVRDAVELHLTTLDDDAWRTRADFAARPIHSGAESFLPGTCAYRIEVDDVRALHAACEAAGAMQPRGALKQQPWGDVEFGVVDPDGNLLTFYQRAAAITAP